MDNINDIISSLSAEDIQALKETAEAIFGNTSKTAAPAHNAFNQPDSGTNNPFLNSGLFQNAEMLTKFGSIMSMLQSNGKDKRCELIEALKPNLSQHRRQKADDAIKILKLLEILPMLSELTGRSE